MTHNALTIHQQIQFVKQITLWAEQVLKQVNHTINLIALFCAKVAEKVAWTWFIYAFCHKICVNVYIRLLILIAIRLPSPLVANTILY